MRTSFPGRRLGRGFTLIELLTTLAVMTLVLGLVPIALDRIVPRRQLDAQAQRLVTGLRDLRSDAMASGMVKTVGIKDDGSLWVGERRLALAEPVAASLDSHLRQIAFHPDGSTSGGEIVLASPAGELRLRVSAATGLVRVLP